MNSVYMERDLLWEELELDSLVNSMNPITSLTEQIESTFVPKSKVLKKFKNLVEKPSYNVLIDRYRALPHRPVTINASKLSKLADPLRMRSDRYEKLLHEPITTSTTTNETLNSPNNSNLTHSDQDTSLSSTKHKIIRKNHQEEGGFFVTGGDLLDNYNDNSYQEKNKKSLRINNNDNNIIESNKRNNGLAAVLRNRIDEANKLEVLKVPILSSNMKNKTLITSKLNNKLNNNIPSKKPWEDNNSVSYKTKKPIKKNNNVNIYANIMNKKNINNVNNKVSSSGYGKVSNNNTSLNKNKIIPKLKERLLKRLIHNETSVNNDITNTNKLIKNRLILRSKSTIDILDPTEEYLKVKSKFNLPERNANKSGTHSAPGLLHRNPTLKKTSRNKVMSVEDSKWYTLEGLTKVSSNLPIRSNNQLSPLKPVIEKKKTLQLLTKINKNNIDNTIDKTIINKISSIAIKPSSPNIKKYIYHKIASNDNMINNSISEFKDGKNLYSLENSIERLQKYDQTSQLITRKSFNTNYNSNSKSDITSISLLTKHAKNLNSYFSDAQTHLNEYRNIDNINNNNNTNNANDDISISPTSSIVETLDNLKSINDKYYKTTTTNSNNNYNNNSNINTDSSYLIERELV